VLNLLKQSFVVPCGYIRIDRLISAVVGRRYRLTHTKGIKIDFNSTKKHVTSNLGVFAGHKIISIHGKEKC